MEEKAGRVAGMSETGAPEITAEMIAAGVAAMPFMDDLAIGSMELTTLVSEVYLAMEHADPRYHEIEVTPAMVEAGAKIIADLFDEPMDWWTRELSSEIFRVMWNAKTATQEATAVPVVLSA